TAAEKQEVKRSVSSGFASGRDGSAVLPRTGSIHALAPQRSALAPEPEPAAGTYPISSSKDRTSSPARVAAASVTHRASGRSSSSRPAQAELCTVQAGKTPLRPASSSMRKGSPSVESLQEVLLRDRSSTGDGFLSRPTPWNIGVAQGNQPSTNASAWHQTSVMDGPKPLPQPQPRQSFTSTTGSLEAAAGQQEAGRKAVLQHSDEDTASPSDSFSFTPMPHARAQLRLSPTAAGKPALPTTTSGPPAAAARNSQEVVVPQQLVGQAGNDGPGPAIAAAGAADHSKAAAQAQLPDMAGHRATVSGMAAAGAVSGSSLGKQVASSRADDGSTPRLAAAEGPGNTHSQPQHSLNGYDNVGNGDVKARQQTLA
ncbi:hypothetical protein HaLaN_32327, partial [Haematococcus lacustris]